ncbi:hypothetical protein IX325_001532 [Fusobacterium necrophorum subsp. funduliforme]|nr:hypothetical protein [Fusobacterium necrophorum]MBR8723215.1 hypothetical protein [Fusobacterium necrophorum subsp. funduliforme]
MKYSIRTKKDGVYFVVDFQETRIPDKNVDILAKQIISYIAHRDNKETMIFSHLLDEEEENEV